MLELTDSNQFLSAGAVWIEANFTLKGGNLFITNATGKIGGAAISTISHVGFFQTCQVQVDSNQQLQCVLITLESLMMSSIVVSDVLAIEVACGLVAMLFWPTQLYPSTSATRNALSVECGLPVILSRHVLWKSLRTSHAVFAWFKLMVSPVLAEWLGSNGENCGRNPKMIRGQSTPLCSFTLASVSCGFLVLFSA